MSLNSGVATLNREVRWRDVVVAEGTVRTIETSAPADVVFDIAADVARFPEWIRGFREVEVLEEDEQGRPVRARQVLDGMVRTISYTLQYSYDDHRQISWSAEPCEDLKELEGRYEFIEMEDGGTEIVYALRVNPNFPVPGFLRRQAEKQIVGTALRGLRDRAEQSVGN